MDISKASNFERFVADVLGRDGARVRALFHDALAQQGEFDLGAQLQAWQAGGQLWASGKSVHADRLATIRQVHERHGQIIDTHTADGVKVARERLRPGVPMLVLETALPVKFAATIEEALGCPPPRPPQFEGLENLPRRVRVLPADAQQIKALIEQVCE